MRIMKKNSVWTIDPTDEEREKIALLWMKIGKLVDGEDLRVALLAVGQINQELTDVWMKQNFEKEQNEVD